MAYEAIDRRKVRRRTYHFSSGRFVQLSALNRRSGGQVAELIQAQPAWKVVEKRNYLVSQVE